MTRRFKGMMTGERYCASERTGQVHDLDNEKYRCHIDQILNAGEDRPFATLSAASGRGYELCPLCLGGAPAQPDLKSTGKDIQAPQGTYTPVSPP